MKIFEFEVLIPTTLKEALDLKQEYKQNLLMLGGGTDLLVQIRNGRKQLKKDHKVLNLTHLEELHKIEIKENFIRIGCNVTFSEIINNKLIKEIFPSLVRSLEIIGSLQIRNMGTLVGNICNASPAADSLPLLYCSDSTLTLQSQKGKRTVKIEDFIKGPGIIDLKEDEIVTFVNIPLWVKDYVGIHLTLRQRIPLSINKVSVAILLKSRENYTVEDAKIALGAVAPTILRVREAEDYLKGKKITKEIMNEVGKLCEKTARPITDVRSTIEYRKAMAGVLAVRALKRLQQQTINV